MISALPQVWSLKDGLVHPPPPPPVAATKRALEDHVQAQWETRSESGVGDHDAGIHDWDDCASIASEPMRGRWGTHKRKRSFAHSYDGMDSVCSWSPEQDACEQTGSTVVIDAMPTDVYCILEEQLAEPKPVVVQKRARQRACTSAPAHKPLDFTGRRPVFHTHIKRRNK